MTDAASGGVWKARVVNGALEKTLIAGLADPVHVERSDLDGDGMTDYVIADMGSMSPETHFIATLWWMRRVKDRWQRVPLKLGLTRVCDVGVFDHDGDGDQDLVVAEFGYRFLGSIHLLTQTGRRNGIPQFDWRILDERNGPIHVPVVDFNNDGRPDIVTLVSQEHESIDVQLNQGNGEFERRLIYSAPDPSYGSSGIEVVDMDGDGDLDVLYTNGDTFDDFHPKPFHAVRWLENEGKFPFTHHLLTEMPGCYRALAGDLDLDGDMDVVAASLLSDGSRRRHSSQAFDGIIWLEQTEPNTFARHRLLAEQCDWACMELMDIDIDGDLDLLTGPYSISENGVRPMILYRNQVKP